MATAVQRGVVVVVNRESGEIEELPTLDAGMFLTGAKSVLDYQVEALRGVQEEVRRLSAEVSRLGTMVDDLRLGQQLEGVR